MLKPETYSLENLKLTLGNLPEPVLNPVLIIVSGLPGTGKSYLSRKLMEKIPACVIETDAIRKILWDKPVYDAVESVFLFKVCHEFIYNLLQNGISVIFDATNLSEYHREKLYNIGEKTNAKIIVVAVTAPEDVIKQRLDVRKNKKHVEDISDAGWDIYKKMVPDQQKIRRNFISADTSRDVSTMVNKIIRMIDK
jgi:predicted kinase